MPVPVVAAASALVPSIEEHDALEDRVVALEATPPGTNEDPRVGPLTESVAALDVRADLADNQLAALAASATSQDAAIGALDDTITEHASRIAVLEARPTGSTPPPAPSGAQLWWAQLDPSGSPVANGSAIRSAAVEAKARGLDVGIPVGLFKVDHNPYRVDGYTERLWYVGTPGRSILRQEGTGEMWFYRDDGSDRHRDNGWYGIIHEGGPTETATQRGTVNPQHFGFWLEGASDQRYRWVLCQMRTLAGVINLEGSNNTSELGLYDTDIMHTTQYAYRFANHQALNVYAYGGKHELYLGSDLVRFDPRTGDGSVQWGGGGAFGIYGSSIILQDPGASLVQVNAPQTSVVTIDAAIELRNRARLFDSNGNHQANVVFRNRVSTIDTTGVTRLVTVRPNQTVQFQSTKFEHNGSSPDFEVLGGRVLLDGCAVPQDLQSLFRWGSPAVGDVRARDCYYRYGPGWIDFTLRNGVAV